jgi:hypothetical protein
MGEYQPFGPENRLPIEKQVEVDRSRSPEFMPLSIPFRFRFLEQIEKFKRV